MFCRPRISAPFPACVWLALVCVTALPSALPTGAQAQETPAQAEAKPAAQALSKEELASATRIDSLSIPTPGELTAALGKVGKMDWSSKFRPPTATNFRSRAQMALNLGGLIADGYIAVEAQDAQQVKNIGRDILALAKPLGVQQEIINRGKSLTDFAAEGKWDVLKEELEATQNETKQAMAANKDSDLVTLVTIGGWLRGTEVLSGYLAEHYTADGAKLLRQPGIVSFMAQQLDLLPDKVREESLVKKTRAKLTEIEALVGKDTPPDVEGVKRLNTAVAELLKSISNKESK